MPPCGPRTAPHKSWAEVTQDLPGSPVRLGCTRLPVPTIVVTAPADIKRLDSTLCSITKLLLGSPPWDGQCCNTPGQNPHRNWDDLPARRLHARRSLLPPSPAP